MKKYAFIFISLFSMVVMAQEKPILLFPDGAPAKHKRLTQSMTGMAPKWEVVLC
jgi:hypothetical protein